MFIQQLYTNCLAHAAYYIESNNEAAVIDPLRDPEPYLELARARGSKIRYVLETHFHADFVSGHIDLAYKTGAHIIFGPGAVPAYSSIVAHDGDVLHLGDALIKVLHTPGHTIESACYLLINELGKENAVFTGDTLFVGDVGRPDLLSGNLGKEELAAMLFDSLNTKIKTLPDDVIVYPGHGPGSACGKNMGPETFSTIGEQKRSNYALVANDKDDFISKVTSDLPSPPAYFFKDAAINKKGYEPLDKIIEAHLKPLFIDEFNLEWACGDVILDTREATIFGQAFIKGSINIGLKGDFATWVGTLIDFDAPLLLVSEKGDEREAVTRLARIGYENVRGYLDGGMGRWLAAFEPVDEIPVYSYEQPVDFDTYTLLDVRKEAEVKKERIAGAVHIPLNKLKELMPFLVKGKSYLIYCAGGYRSMIAASLLKANGFKDVASMAGGINLVKRVSPHLVEQFESVK